MRSLALRTAALFLGVALTARAEGSRELNVFAAASLRESFAELGKLFETRHPATKVQFNLGGSQELRTQIEHGRPPTCSPRPTGSTCRRSSSRSSPRSPWSSPATTPSWWCRKRIQL